MNEIIEKFSKKQLIALTWYADNSPYRGKDYIFGHGSIRSGKTFAFSIGYFLWAMTNFNGRLFGVAGKTVGSLRKNVFEQLFPFIESIGFKVEERKNENLVMVTGHNVSNKFELFGGKDEASETLIRGRTLTGIFLDEATVMPESFVLQALGRLTYAESKGWLTGNPGNPFHYLKTDFLEKADEKKLLELHFTLDDNLSLDPRVIDRLKSTYTGLFYKRFILGQWVVAEGAVYDMFERSKHVADVSRETFKNYMVGVDYGTSNPTVFGLYGFNDSTKIYRIAEYVFDSARAGRQKTDGEYAKDFINFVGSAPISAVYVDPSAASFKLELINQGFPVFDADHDVLDGIRFVSQCLNSGRFYIDRSCDRAIMEFEVYSWDPKRQALGEDRPLKINDHAMDEIRYALYSHFGMGGVAYGHADREERNRWIA